MPRPRFRDKLETWFVVTVITVLIWLYAEGAIVQTYQRQRVPITFVPADDIAAAIEPAQSRAYVTFRGSSGQLQAFKSLLEQGPVRIPLQPGDEPVQAVDLTEVLEQLVFNDLGVAIEEVDPETEPVTVRRLITRTVSIDVEHSGLQLTADPVVNPTSVQVTLPEDLAPLLDRLPVRLDQAVAERKPTTGTPHVWTLEVELPPEVRGRWTELKTSQAEVSFTLAKGDATLVLPAVPLRDVTPLDFAYEVVPEGGEKVIEVRLTGPSDVLERIEARESGYEVWAELRFFNVTELTPGPRTIDVFFHTPPGVQAEGLPQITVNLVPKTEVGTANGANNGN